MINRAQLCSMKCEDGDRRPQTSTDNILTEEVVNVCVEAPEIVPAQCPVYS